LSRNKEDTRRAQEFVIYPSAARLHGAWSLPFSFGLVWVGTGGSGTEDDAFRLTLD
jgi:hypothetical protein